jgi:hypothetical protein
MASSAVEMDVADLTQRATDVVRARVTSTRSAWTEDGRRLVTFVEVQVLEPYKGVARGHLTLLQPGGELDGLGQHVSGVARLDAGEEVVLFLERQGPVHRLVGLAQGVFRVSREGNTVDARAVRASLEGLELLAPSGQPPRARSPMTLDRLRQAVRTAAKQP